MALCSGYDGYRTTNGPVKKGDGNFNCNSNGKGKGTAKVAETEIHGDR